MNNELALQENGVQIGSLNAKNPHDVITVATAVAKELKQIVKDRALSKIIQGREYIYVDAWTTMGAMLGVTARELPEFTRELDNGDWEATVELCRMVDGAVVGRGSALVGMEEKDRNGKATWGSRPKYARRSMAITRATGKAYRIAFSWIATLAGYAPTPAEEMDGIVDGEFTEKNTTKKQPVQNAEKPVPVRTLSEDYQPKMTLVSASEVVNSKGQKYVEIDTTTLSHMWNSMNKLADKTDEHMMKMDAIDTIIHARQQQPSLIPQEG